MNLNLKGKTAVVTGASKGLGRSIAKALAAEGVTVFAVARSAELLGTLADEIDRTGNPARSVFTQDFTHAEAPSNIARAAEAALGHVDILINNAGRSGPVPWDAADEAWAKGMTLNFERHRQLTQQLLPGMIERGDGRLLHISGSMEPRRVNVATAAKAALVIWSKGLSQELGRKGIRSNCIEPGAIESEQTARLSPEMRDKLARETSLGQLGKPEEIAAAAVFLVSDAASYITGVSLIVDGGIRRRAF